MLAAGTGVPDPRHRDLCFKGKTSIVWRGTLDTVVRRYGVCFGLAGRSFVRDREFREWFRIILLEQEFGLRHCNVPSVIRSSC